ncbi:MAG: diguanylate cyclase [Clostridia bacterium]|nr:diguanylate cyclase [Clostridia bacterium]
MKRKIGLTTRYVIIVCALLLALSVAAGVVLMRQSGMAMKSMIRKHMLSVADTAAALVDEEELATLTEADVGGEKYRRICETLLTIKNSQKDEDIKYIYLIKREGDHYVFTVDPDPVSPADFGQEVVYTPAQDVAWSGRGEVDDTAYEDDWGCFYSAWSPVKDSSGAVVGIVGVDFVADSYDRQMRVHSAVVAVTGTLTVLIGLAIMLLLTRQLNRRLGTINAEVSVLSGDVDKLAQEIAAHSKTSDEGAGALGASFDEAPVDPANTVDEKTADAIVTLRTKIVAMQHTLREYVAYVNKQAMTDSMTGTGNKRAYLDRIREMNQRIASGDADFAVAVFDINGLKVANDNYGHECGDHLISDAARLICRIFERERIYRIGGDEFIAVLDPISEEEMAERFARLDKEVEAFNQYEKRYAVKMALTFSKGGAVFRPGEDTDFKDVFRRADHAMYRDKGNFYRIHGDRRRKEEDQD